MHRKWGYQNDNVEREASYGYADNTVVYHFGHHDNIDNGSNRPSMRHGASNLTEASLVGIRIFSSFLNPPFTVVVQ